MKKYIDIHYIFVFNVIESVVFSFTNLYLKLSSYKFNTKTNHGRNVSVEVEKMHHVYFVCIHEKLHYGIIFLENNRKVDINKCMEWYPDNCAPRKIAPRLGLGYRSRLGLVLGLGEQLDNCSRGK